MSVGNLRKGCEHIYTSDSLAYGKLIACWTPKLGMEIIMLRSSSQTPQARSYVGNWFILRVGH